MHRKKNSVHIQDGHLQQLILGKQRIIDIKNGWNNQKKIKFVDKNSLYNTLNQIHHWYLISIKGDLWSIDLKRPPAIPRLLQIVRWLRESAYIVSKHPCL